MAEEEQVVEKKFVVDLDRGVSKRSYDGIQVCMYKDDPGIYFDNLGNTIKDEFAKAAGFPIAELKLEKEKMARMKTAQLDIEKEYSTIPGQVIHQSDDFEVVCIDDSQGKYNVRRKDDKKFVNANPMDKKRCIDLCNSIK